MKHQSIIPKSLISLNLDVHAVSQIAGAVIFIEVKGQAAAVDGTQGCTFQKA
jgi:hypothetical protein